MSSSLIEPGLNVAEPVAILNDSLEIVLNDGRTISAPLAWYPRLSHASSSELSNWRLIGNGVGIHWPEIDEDISVDDLVKGLPSSESQTSLKRWLEARSLQERNGQNRITDMSP